MLSSAYAFLYLKLHPRVHYPTLFHQKTNHAGTKKSWLDGKKSGTAVNFFEKSLKAEGNNSDK